MMTSHVPEGWVLSTRMAPISPSVIWVAVALESPALKEVTVVGGAGIPSAETRRLPAVEADSTVTFAVTARASSGTPHVPAIGNRRDRPAGKPGPDGLVSTARHGETV